MEKFELYKTVKAKEKILKSNEKSFKTVLKSSFEPVHCIGTEYCTKY